MKSKITYPLREAEVLDAPAITAGVSAAEYVDALLGASTSLPGKEQAKGRAYCATLHRWLEKRISIDDPLAVHEDVLAELHDDMVTGRFRTKDRKKFVSFARKILGGLRRMHNSLVGQDKRFTRELIGTRQHQMFTYFRSLTPKTQKALVWFVENATKKKSKNGTRRILMTERTRSRGIEAMFSLLRMLDVNGIELVTREMVEKLVPKPDPKDPRYRKCIRDIHDCRPVFRCCLEEEYIERNPLTDIPDDDFDAEQDFILPEGLAKFRDLSTVDMNNDWQVIARMISLLYADTGVRRNELAGLKLSQVRKTENGWTLHLLPENQKGHTKPATVPTLYAETELLLEHYMTVIRPRYPSDHFAVGRNGKQASGDTCARYVKQEAARLSIPTYHNKNVTPHALRHTFGTLNINPLGMQLDIAYIANRLRHRIDTCYDYYVLDNPLLQEAKAGAIKAREQRAAQGINKEDLIKGLVAADVDPEIIRQVKADMRDRKEAESADNERAAVADRDWIPEAVAVDRLEAAWGAIPTTRALRTYLKSRSAVGREGAGSARTLYDSAIVQELIESYVAASKLNGRNGISSRTVRRLLGEFHRLRIGNVVLISKDDAIDYLQTLNSYRDRNL